MKLRNKKTREIREYGSVGATTFGKGGVLEAFAVYGSLAELNEDWEDVPEEPKVKKHDFYYINENGGVLGYVPFDPDGEDLSYMEYQKEIGNHFKTIEEAEKAVEKLKAWKRLKDKGFRFRWIDKESGNIKYAFYTDLSINHGKINRFDYEDLDLLFGGEE